MRSWATSGTRRLTLNNMGTLAQDRSRWDEARQLYERSLALFERTGDRTTAGLAKYNIAQILSDQGRFEEAEPLLREVLRLWRAAGADADVAEARREMAKLMARTGRLETATRLLDAAREEQHRAGKPGEVLATDVIRAETSVFSADPEGALQTIDDACALARSTDGGGVFLVPLERLRGWALLQAGRPDEADAVLAASLAEAERRGDSFEAALALDGLVAVRSRRDSPTADLAIERSRLTKKLGIVTMPSFPVDRRVPGDAAEATASV